MRPCRKNSTLNFQAQFLIFFEFISQQVYDKNILQLRKPCCVAEELQKTVSLNVNNRQQQLRFSALWASHDIPVDSAKVRELQNEDPFTEKQLSNKP